MRILYVGESGPGTNSECRARALQRLGHEVHLLDPSRLLARSLEHPLAGRVHYRTGYMLLQSRLKRLLPAHLPRGRDFDVAWVNGGELLGRGAIRMLRNVASRVVLYNNDDPTGNRDGARWLTLRRTLPGYDLCAVLREVNVAEYRARGTGRVHRVWMSYDEKAHRPPGAEEIGMDLTSEVAFIGTWMPERGPFMAELVRSGVPLSIWGDHWQKAPEWPVLRVAWRGDAICGVDYARAVAGAKVCLGLLSKGNRDLHTRRSVEVPFIGGLLCAERTREHAMLYRDGTEAVFWSDAAECAARCAELLADEVRRRSIQAEGRRRIGELRLGNEDVCAEVLAVLRDPGHSTVRPFHS